MIFFKSHHKGNFTPGSHKIYWETIGALLLFDYSPIKKRFYDKLYSFLWSFRQKVGVQEGGNSDGTGTIINEAIIYLILFIHLLCIYVFIIFIYLFCCCCCLFNIYRLLFYCIFRSFTNNGWILRILIFIRRIQFRKPVHRNIY